MDIIKKNPFYKKHKKGNRGYPVGTIAYYGPNNKKATKVVVGVFYTEHGGDPDNIKKWVNSNPDIRINPSINKDIQAYIEEQGVRTVVMANRIMGCIHESGLDYPKGEECPICKFWIGKDRFSDVDNPPFI